MYRRALSPLDSSILKILLFLYYIYDQIKMFPDKIMEGKAWDAAAGNSHVQV